MTYGKLAVSYKGVYANRVKVITEDRLNHFEQDMKNKKPILDYKYLHTSTSEESMRGTLQEPKGLSWACRGSRYASST